MLKEIKAITPIDGRYLKLCTELQDIFSEFGLMKKRVVVETSWVNFLSKELKIFKLDKDINFISKNFNEEEAVKIKEIEKTTNHDVKAVEYYIKQKLEENGLASIKEWVHFSCTSDDINNTSYALMLKDGKELIVNSLNDVLKDLEDIAKKYKSEPIMARTHGQPATPSTMGKEFINFAWKIREEIKNLNEIEIEAKFNGATGNFNAHYFTFPEIDWIKESRKFLKDYLKVKPIIYTTQINPCLYISKIFHTMIRLSAIMTDINRDIWFYISIGYFKQKTKKDEVGSSTMPHKVNPIDFENSEGNLGIAISLMEHMAKKLLISRLQRDLTDSTVLRNIGSTFAYFLIAVKNLRKGISKIILDTEATQKDLNNNIELLAEPIQTVMRIFNEENPYEKLKKITRGKKIEKQELNDFIQSLEEVPKEYKDKMQKLTTSTYTGLSEKLVDNYFDESFK